MEKVCFEQKMSAVRSTFQDVFFEIYLKKSILWLTEAGVLVYNSTVQGYILKIIGVQVRLPKGGISHAENLSA